MHNWLKPAITGEKMFCPKCGGPLTYTNGGWFCLSGKMQLVRHLETFVEFYVRRNRNPSDKSASIVFDALQVAKQSNVFPGDDFWASLFDETALSYFWHPTEEEKQAGCAAGKQHQFHNVTLIEI